MTSRNFAGMLIWFDTSSAAPVTDKSRTMQSITSPPNSIVAVFKMRWRRAIRASTIHATGHDSGAAQIEQGDDPTIISQRPRQGDSQAFLACTGDGAEGQAYRGCYIGGIRETASRTLWQPA